MSLLGKRACNKLQIKKEVFSLTISNKMDTILIEDDFDESDNQKRKREKKEEDWQKWLGLLSI